MYDSITGRRNTRPRTPPDEWRGEMAHFDPTTLGHITEVNKNAGASFDMGGGFIPAPAHEDRHEDAPYAEYVYVNRLFIGVNRFSGPPRGRTVRQVRRGKSQYNTNMLLFSVWRDSHVYIFD